MATHYPQMSSGDTFSLAERAYDDGVGARMLTWMRQAYCGLHGHDCLMHFEKDRMSLQCASCGHATPGWELTEPRPIVSVRAEPRARVFQRPHLVSARRIA